MNYNNHLDRPGDDSRMKINVSLGVINTISKSEMQPHDIIMHTYFKLELLILFSVIAFKRSNLVSSPL